MTNNSIINITNEELENNYKGFLKAHPEMETVGKKFIEEVENSYEYHESFLDEPEQFSFRFFGIKLVAVKPERNVEQYKEDLILDNMLNFTDFMRNAKEFDMQVRGNFLVQKMKNNGFAIYGKKDPDLKNSKYSEWLGGLYFDTDDRKEFLEKLEDFETMFMPALGGKVDEAKVTNLIKRRG